MSRLLAHGKYRKGWAHSHFGLSKYWRLPFIGSNFGLVLHLIPGGFLVSSSRGDSTRHGSITEEINHSSLLNVGEIVDGVGRNGSRSRTRPSYSYNSDDHGR